MRTPYNRCGKCLTEHLDMTRLPTEIPTEQILYRYHRVAVTVYHLRSILDGYESLVAVPKDANHV